MVGKIFLGPSAFRHQLNPALIIILSFFSRISRMLLNCQIVFSAAGDVQSAIVGPASVIAFVTSSTTLTCRTDTTHDVCWEFYRSEQSIPRTIYTGTRLNRQYEGTHRVRFGAGGSVHLTLLETRLDDAGVYQCRECSTAHSHDIQLTVIGTPKRKSTGDGLGRLALARWTGWFGVQVGRQVNC